MHENARVSKMTWPNGRWEVDNRWPSWSEWTFQCWSSVIHVAFFYNQHSHRNKHSSFFSFSTLRAMIIRALWRAIMYWHFVNSRIKIDSCCLQAAYRRLIVHCFYRRWSQGGINILSVWYMRISAFLHIKKWRSSLYGLVAHRSGKHKTCFFGSCCLQAAYWTRIVHCIYRRCSQGKRNIHSACLSIS